MKIKKELQAVCAAFGEKTGGYQSTWEEIQALVIVHSVGAVVRDFSSWMEENQGDDFPQGAVSGYLYVAPDRLSGDSQPARAAAKDPEVVSLVRELTYASGGLISFLDKQRARMAEVLKEFSSEEILACFKVWLQDQDLNDPKTGQYGPGKFVQIADSLCYSARKKKQESEQAAKERSLAVQRLQEEAEVEREEKRKAQEAEEAMFDPLKDL